MNTPYDIDDFFIYLADTQGQAEDLVHLIVKENFILGKHGWLEGEGGTIQGLVWGWSTVSILGLAGIHGRVHVWATGHPTKGQRDQVANVTSHWLSHVEWV